MGVSYFMVRILIFVFSIICIQTFTYAKKTLKIATFEMAPYVGKYLPNKGYVQETIIEAFKHSGHNVKVIFYPQKRALYMANTGKVDGIAPLLKNSHNMANLKLSKPFPGKTISLIKKKKRKFKWGGLIEKDLKGLTIALDKDRKYNNSLRNLEIIKKSFVKSDLSKLDMIINGKADLAPIDRYRAAYLLVVKRPNYIGRLDFLQPPLSISHFYLGISKKSSQSDDLIKVFNTGIDHLKKSGLLTKILSKNGLYSARSNKTKQQKTKLIIGTVNNGDMLIMKNLQGDFLKKYPRIEIEWRFMDENTLRKRLLGDIAISDGQFDVMTIGAYEVPIWAQKEWIAPIKNIQRKYDLEDIIGPVRKILSHRQNIYALPFYAESSMTYYRKDVFEKKGIKMVENPTYDDILKFAKIIHNPKDKFYGVCLRGKAGWGENTAFVTTMVNTYGGQWFDHNWRPKIDTKEWKEAITKYVNLLTQYGPPNPAKNGFIENLELFSTGHCGIWIDATVAAGMLFNPNKSKVYNQVGFALAPTGKFKKGYHWLWTWALAMPKSSNHKEAATHFITWATSKEYIELVAKNEGRVSVPAGTRISTYQNLEYQRVAPFSKFVLSAIKNADPINSTVKNKPYVGIQFVGIPEFPAMGHQVGVEISKVIEGVQKIDTCLKRSQKIVKDIMAKSKK